MEFLKEVVTSPSTWVSIFVLVFGIIWITAKTRGKVSLTKNGLIFESGGKSEKKKKTLASPSTIETILAIVNFISTNQQKEFLELRNESDLILHQQLDYVDNCFSAEQFELVEFIDKNVDINNANYLLSSMMFEKTYEGFRKSLIEMIKQNHLAELSDYTFQDKMEQKIKMSINYFKRHLDDYPIELNKQEIIERYSSTVRKIVKSSLTNARILSVEKNKKRSIIEEKYKKERADFITRYFLDMGYSEEDLQGFLEKTF